MNLCVIHDIRSMGKRSRSVFLFAFISVMLLFNSGCSSSKGSSTSTTTGMPLPPVNLTVSQNTNGVILTWTASTGAASYKVYQSTKSGGSYSNIASSTITTCTVTGLSNGTVYYFVVTALNSKGESGYSNEVSATPQLITNTFTVGSVPLGIAIDASGNVWVANYSSNNVEELVGVATGSQYWSYKGPQWP